MNPLRLVLVFGLLVAAVQSPGQTDNRSLIDSAPRLDGATYVCKDMVRVVNTLRRGGKAAALEALASAHQDKKVLAICRLLFVNTNGWQPLIFGQIVPTVNKEVISEFPLFPIALSDGVPFLLIDGYNAGAGSGENVLACIAKCRSLELIPADLPETGFRGAAEKLMKSEQFRRLYSKEDDADGMRTNFLLQAAGLAREFRLADYLRARTNVVMVCVYADSCEDKDSNDFPVHHFKSTVIKSYKGDWKVSEKLSCFGMVSPMEHVGDSAVGELFFVSLNGHSGAEIHLEASCFLDYDDRIEQHLELLSHGREPLQSTP